jgi:hypothetical protein
VRRVVAIVVLAALVPVVYSYASAMLQPSSLSLGVRSVEWLKANHGAWLVNNVERMYYTWNAPTKGGPALKKLPGFAPATSVAAKPVAYRPAPIAPVIHPALPGEGIWHSSGVAVQGEPGVLMTEFRPEASYPQNVAYVAWIDHTRTQLALYPGRYEPPSAPVRGPMAIPWGQRWRLLASFNSGFTYKDGHGGFALNGRSYTPLRTGAATLVAWRDGTVDIVTWRGGTTPGRGIVLARQNLPLIVSGGRPSSALSIGSEWGATLGNAVRVWRSGVGVDRRGNLIYAAANYQTVGTLASILIHAGAVRAMELDINAEWPTFITYARGGARDASKLVPNYQQSTSRYLAPDDRDFFAVYRRVPRGSSLVPFK